MKRHRSNERNGAFFMSSGGKIDKGANIYEYFHTDNTSILHILLDTIHTRNTSKKHIQIEKILYKQHDICDILPQRIIEKISVSLVLGKIMVFSPSQIPPIPACFNIW